MEKKPYDFIAKQLQAGQVIPFLGSAASAAGIPEGDKRLPTGNGLSRELVADYACYPGAEGDPLTKVAQFCEECVGGRRPLYDRLRKRFYESQIDVEPGPVAQLLASVARPLLIITTNYDPHLEAAHRRAGKRFEVITHITNRRHPRWGWLVKASSDAPSHFEVIKPADFDLKLDCASVIYKMHGTFGQGISAMEDTVVVTENDYVDFIVMTEWRRFPPAIGRALQTNHVLFLGYSLEDWNLRVILRRLQRAAELGNDYRSWAIQLTPSEMEKRFWEHRGVDLFDEDLVVFAEQLRGCLR